MNHVQIPQDKVEVYNRLEKDLVRIIKIPFRINQGSPRNAIVAVSLFAPTAFLCLEMCLKFSNHVSPQSIEV